MPKLPKKSTMKETINRVRGYSWKLFENQKITSKVHIEVTNVLNKLQAAIDK